MATAQSCAERVDRGIGRGAGRADDAKVGSRLNAQRVTNLYDVMDAAYCSTDLREDSRSLGHVPLIDHNPRGGVKLEFASHEAARYKERTVAERMNARMKDEFGANNIWVHGPVKVMSHLMFGVLVLSADQLMRLVL